VKCFRLPDVKFTIRSLMIAVMAAAVCFAVLRAGRDFLLVSVLVLIPLLGLIGIWTQVPPQRVSWQFGILAAMLGLIILGMGWLWARSVIWHFQRQEGFVAIGGASHGEDYEFWGSTLPGCVTGIGLIVHVLLLTVACAPRRSRSLLLLVPPYALALTAVYIILFADLEFEAFD
jgi:hypothetical protein